MTQARSTFEEKLESELLGLVSRVSSIRAGKTFTPTDYTSPTKQAIRDLIKSDIIDRKELLDCFEAVARYAQDPYALGGMKPETAVLNFINHTNRILDGKDNT